MTGDFEARYAPIRDLFLDPEVSDLQVAHTARAVPRNEALRSGTVRPYPHILGHTRHTQLNDQVEETPRPSHPLDHAIQLSLGTAEGYGMLGRAPGL